MPRPSTHCDTLQSTVPQPLTYTLKQHGFRHAAWRVEWKVITNVNSIQFFFCLSPIWTAFLWSALYAVCAFPPGPEHIAFSGWGWEVATFQQSESKSFSMCVSEGHIYCGTCSLITDTASVRHDPEFNIKLQFMHLLCCLCSVEVCSDIHEVL